MKKDLLYYINEFKKQVKQNLDYFNQIQNLNSLLSKKDKELKDVKIRLEKQIGVNKMLINENLFLGNQLDKFIAERNKVRPYGDVK